MKSTIVSMRDMMELLNKKHPDAPEAFKQWYARRYNTLRQYSTARATWAYAMSYAYSLTRDYEGGFLTAKILSEY